MPEKIKWLAIDQEDADKWFDLCQENCYRIVEPDEIIDFLPDGLRGGYTRKLDTSIVINKVASFSDGTSSGTFVIADLHRIDKGGYVIDQDPYILASVSGELTPRPSGAFFLHGSWPGRTFEPDWSVDAPNQVLHNIHSSGIDEYYPSMAVITDNGGPINGLEHTRYKETINHTLSKINPKWHP